MFLIRDRRYGKDHFVFTHMNPRTEGYQGDVAEDIQLDYDMNAIHRVRQEERKMGSAYSQK